jgi:AcrR family transcriptional regulator
MLQAAEGLMREGGYDAAGIKQVVARSRAPIGSVYHHFPGGKTQLAVEALGQHAVKASTLLESVFARNRPVADRVRALFTMAARGFDGAGCRRGCAIGAVSADLGPDDDELRRACAESLSGWIDTIAHHLPWRSRRARRSFAQMIVVAFEGAFIVGRATRSGEPFLTAGEWLAAAAESYAQE